MSKHLRHVLSYFAHFSYAPSFDEISTFFPVKISRKALHALIKSESDAGKLVQLQPTNGFNPFPRPTAHYSLVTSHSKYTLPQYSIQPRIKIYISLLKWLPLVRFVGMTGKSAVEGVRRDDDIDLFIITKSRLLWTTRFCVVLLAKLLGIHGGTGVCLNLFFDESNLTIPRNKQNEYIAHELLQMKPIIDKQKIYSALLEANRWIFKIFPNTRINKTEDRRQNNGLFSFLTSIFYLLEPLARLIQLPIIKKNKTSFLITSTQLWLFKRDFERKLKRKGVRKVI